MPRHAECYYGELFRQAWINLGASGDPKLQFDAVMERMREPHRKHHTPKHIFESLDVVEDFGHLAVHFDEVVVAMVVHDQVMKFERGAQNEKESADLADQMLRQARVSYLPRRRIYSGVMGTKHSYYIRSYDAQLAADADLSILGSSSTRYWEYVEDIVDEYSFVPVDLYRQGRIALVLNPFLAKHNPTAGKFIYYTPEIRDQYEEQAVENITKEKEILLTGKKFFLVS